MPNHNSESTPIRLLATLVSVPLKRIIPPKKGLRLNIDDVKAISSGCIVLHRGKSLLLSVAHNLSNDPNCILYICTDDDQNSYIPLDPIIFGIGDEYAFNQIDLLVAELNSNLECYHKLRDGDNFDTISSYKRIKIPSSHITEAKSTDDYFFSGNTNPITEYHPGINIFTETYILEENLRFIESDGFYDFFRLSGNHRGDSYYEGTSGAPIINQDGQLIGLVCNGKRSDENLITGISLTKCMNIIDNSPIFLEIYKII